MLIGNSIPDSFLLMLMIYIYISELFVHPMNYGDESAQDMLYLFSAKQFASRIDLEAWMLTEGNHYVAHFLKNLLW